VGVVGVLPTEAFDPDNSMGGPGAATLRYMGGKYLPDIRDKYEIYRFITPVFLHAGILHIFFNLLFQVPSTFRHLSFVKLLPHVSLQHHCPV
jgi:membrane associated rhomboid family serine protease